MLFQMAIASRLEDVPLLSDGLCRSLAARFGEDGLVRLQIGLAEAANNIVQHACQGREDRTISLSCRPDGCGVLLVLEDDGVASDRDLNAAAVEAAANPPDFFAENGRGLWLLLQCFPTVRFERKDGINRLILHYTG
ncbi:ATP-binding protein [Azospirillum picis]|uniref:Anti-sigma regulatory factor (Ser/Thr protein kinase) n=1 Tax=Azospirillum picis TaxID=488438 RepID=A0ABU0MV93_9PROT|nr:ATP-binding protein [Azospirillum picis]MBP2303513.1 anti-sigma regulatory factor (Ser/Thr protein kinase) [Azospirillum picis]MDQ0537416.1 anti-sigma regulatory factor (Ser/Thr protein kinase) [Azospirillum picis]